MKEKRVVPPVLNVSGESIPEAWENSYLALADQGLEYQRRDQEDSGDQISAIMTIEMRNPDADPFAHLKGGTNALDAPLLDYMMEIMGSKNSWIRDFSDPTDTRWDYMYHERLAKRPNPGGKPINQIEFAKKRLIENHSSRRINLITWYPPRDMEARHTPCLQRIWFEIIPGEEKDHLDMHYSFRSRNVVNAAFGNMMGLYILGCDVRDAVEQVRGKPLDMRVVEYNDAYHVNSHEYPLFLNLIKNLKEKIKQGETLEERTWTREMVVNGLREARGEVEQDLLEQTAKHYKGDMERERERVHAIGDRVFYLLDKYAPKKD